MKYNAQNYVIGIGVPLVMLFIGWQLGMSYEHRFMTQSGIISSTVVTGSGQIATDPEHQVNVSLLWNVWNMLLNKYIQPTDLQTQKMVYGAAQGLVAAVGDPYTVFMPPQQNTAFHEMLQGNLQGIGAELQIKDGLVVIITPLKKSPAEKAGILPNDVIAEVDGKSTEGLTLDEVVGQVRGKEGTKVKLTIVRDKEPKPLTFEITRESIQIPTVESNVLTTSGGLIGYIALNQFGDTSTAEMKQALTSFQGKKLKGIILDERGKGGGYLNGAVDIASMFLKEGLVVSVASRDGTEVHNADGSPLFPDTPLVILINQGSASASEILAGALQDHHRATIVGMKSFGKGTVQEVIDLPDGSSLRVTVAHWLTPNGKNLGKEGVQPDIVVDVTADDIKAKRDPQLSSAEQWLLYGKKVSTGSGATSSK